MTSLPGNVLLRGCEAPASERIALRAGPLSTVFEPEGAFLRHVRLGDVEILRGVYAAVRDRHWRTPKPRVSDLAIERRDGGFELTFDAECKEREIHFAWRGRIAGDKTGKVTLSFEGRALSTFMRSRIGFCVLHPIRECAGKPCVVEKVDGTVERGAFPYDISPRQPFKDIRAIRTEVTPGLSAEVRFEGEVFEMEDQRNWTDASYKTYCTPLALPFPVEIEKGTAISQSVTLTLQGAVPAVPRDAEAAAEGVLFTLGSETPTPLPRIGLCAADHGRPVSEKQKQRLADLRLSHLRTDIRPSVHEWQARFRSDAELARSTGASLEVALILGDRAEAELESVAAIASEVAAPVTSWLVFHEGGTSSALEGLRLARQYLPSCCPDAGIGGGANGYFTGLNRNRPAADAMDIVAYSVNPQVHVFDDASMVETLEIQGWTVRSARRFCADLPIAVTPVTLKSRRKPEAAGSEADSTADGFPPDADVRQMSLFCAAWTAGSIKYVAEAGAWSVTYFETIGPKGVMENEKGSPYPEFRSLPGGVFPVYHVLADVGEFAGGEVLPTLSSDPLAVDGIALRKGGRSRVILANMSFSRQDVALQGFGRAARTRVLDESNAESAMLCPEDFRKAETGPAGLPLRFGLPPYAVATIDLAKD